LIPECRQFPPPSPRFAHHRHLRGQWPLLNLLSCLVALALLRCDLDFFQVGGDRLPIDRHVTFVLPRLPEVSDVVRHGQTTSLPCSPAPTAEREGRIALVLPDLNSAMTLSRFFSKAERESSADRSFGRQTASFQAPATVSVDGLTHVSGPPPSLVSSGLQGTGRVFSRPALSTPPSMSFSTPLSLGFSAPPPANFSDFSAPPPANFSDFFAPPPANFSYFFAPPSATFPILLLRLQRAFSLNLHPLLLSNRPIPRRELNQLFVAFVSFLAAIACFFCHRGRSQSVTLSHSPGDSKNHSRRLSVWVWSRPFERPAGGLHAQHSPLKRKSATIFGTERSSAWPVSLPKRYVARVEGTKSEKLWKANYHDRRALPSRFTNRMDSGKFTMHVSNLFVALL
jgi:hypothetical protein